MALIRHLNGLFAVLAAAASCAVLTAGAANLPYVAQLKYLAADGNQYVNTGYTSVLATWEYRLDAKLDANKRYGGANGYMQLYTDDKFDGERHFINLKADLTGDSRLYLDNSDTSVLTEQWGRQTQYQGLKIYVLALGHTTGGIFTGTQPQTGLVYSFQLVKDGVLLRDFIPVLVREDGKLGACFYDRVSGELFKNEKTGKADFIYEESAIESWVRNGFMVIVQ